MKHNIIKTDNYLLVVDESEIKNEDWVYFECLPYSKEIKQVTTIINNAFDSKEGFGYGLEYCKKIIAHLPLNGSPILQGVDLLPPLEEEDDSIGWLLIHYINEKHNQDRVMGFCDGYNKAKEKYKYTEEDVIKIVEKSRETGLTAEYLMLSLSQPKTPTGFECETRVFEEEYRKPIRIATTTTPEGRTQWEGTYIYE